MNALRSALPFVPTDQPDPGTFDAIFRELDACSADLIGPAQPRFLAIPIRDDGGQVAGGLWGCTIFGWLNIQMLFVPEILRGRGVGSSLVREAEREARGRDCRGVQLTVFSFQATSFYERLGYTRFATLEDFPPGQACHHFKKRLDDA